MNSAERIMQASLDSMRELTLEQLYDERENIERHVEDAVAVARDVIDRVIAEKILQRSYN